MLSIRLLELGKNQMGSHFIFYYLWCRDQHLYHLLNRNQHITFNIKGAIMTELKIKSLDIEVNVRNEYYNPSATMPLSPSKPHLKPKHTSAEAQEYVTKLSRYEAALLLYQSEMTHYRQIKNNLATEFRRDAIVHVGLIVGSKSADRAFYMASDRGGSRLEIVENLEEIADVMIMYKNEWIRA